MKRTMLLAAFVAVILAATACDLDGLLHARHDRDEVIITEAELPAVIKDFITNHFPGQTITRAKKELDDYDYYSVRLQNGTELDFSQAGDWLDIDGHRNPIPASILSLLPATITQYINTNHPGRAIQSVNKERYGYEIELVGGLDLEFDNDGKFLRADR